MKTSTTIRKLSRATALAAISVSTVSISQVEAAVNQVDPGSLVGTGCIPFHEVDYTPPNTAIPGINYDNSQSFVDYPYCDTTPNSNPNAKVSFAERFQGQILNSIAGPGPGMGQFDQLSGNPSNFLSLQAGAPNQNIAVWMPDKYLTGLGNYMGGFDNNDAIGEGAISILFTRPQTEFGFLLYGSDPMGSVTLNFFGSRNSSLANNTLLGTLTLDDNTQIPFGGYKDKYYGFKTTPEDKIWGVSITNLDPEGISIDNIMYDNPGSPLPPPPQDVPEPSSVLGLLGIGALGAGLKLLGKLKG